MEKEAARNMVVGILKKAKALRALRQDNSVVIIPADKGRLTVVMDKEIYDQKIQELLSDGRVYKRLQ